MLCQHDTCKQTYFPSLSQQKLKDSHCKQIVANISVSESLGQQTNVCEYHTNGIFKPHQFLHINKVRNSIVYSSQSSI